MLGVGAGQVSPGSHHQDLVWSFAVIKKYSAKAKYFSEPLIVVSLEELRYGIADRAVAVPNTRAQRADYQNDDKHNERKNDSVLDKTLTLFLCCK